MKKVLMVVCVLLLACSTLSMAELMGDALQFDFLFTDESPYLPGDKVRVSVLVMNSQDNFQPIRLFWEMMDPSGTAATGAMQKNIAPLFAGTLSFGKPLPEGADPGLYTWTGRVVMLTGGSWVPVGQQTLTFNVGDGASAPGTDLSFNCALYPDTFAQGESFTLDAMVSNGTENGANVEVQSYIVSPSGHEYILGPHPMAIAAMGSSAVHFVITPHLGAVSGEYAVSQQLLDNDGQLLSEIPAGFTITGASFAALHGDALLALAAVPEENKLDPEYDLAADLDNIVTLFNAGDAQAALAQAQAIIDYLPEKLTTAGEYAPALDAMVDYLEASLNMNFTFSLS